MEESQRVFGASDERTAIQVGLYADALLASGDVAGARENFAKAVPTLLDMTEQSLDESGQARLDRWRTAVFDGDLSVLAKDGSADAVTEAFRVADAARGQSVQHAVAKPRRVPRRATPRSPT